MNDNDDATGVIIGIAIVVFFGWLIFSAIGSSSSSSEGGESYDSSTVEYEAEPEYEYDGDNESYYESRGYGCTSDCSGHDAGYEWADENGVCDEYYSESYSESFDEGVRVYAEDNC